MDIFWARHQRHKNRYGTISVSLSSTPFEEDKANNTGDAIMKASYDMDRHGQVKYEWPEAHFESTRYIKIQQEEKGELKGDKWRGLEISSVKVYGSKCD